MIAFTIAVVAVVVIVIMGVCWHADAKRGDEYRDAFDRTHAKLMQAETKLAAIEEALRGKK